MGQNNSKRSSESKNARSHKIPQNTKHPFHRMLEPFKAKLPSTTPINTISINNNLLKPLTAASTTSNQTSNPDINNNICSEVESVPILTLHDNQKRNQIIPTSLRNITPFSFIQSTLSRLFGSKRGRGQGSSSAIIGANTVLGNITDCSSTPIIRKAPVENKCNRHFYRKNNVFARPVTPEVVVVCVENAIAWTPNLLDGIIPNVPFSSISAKDVPVASGVSLTVFPALIQTKTPQFIGHRPQSEPVSQPQKVEPGHVFHDGMGKTSIDDLSSSGSVISSGSLSDKNKWATEYKPPTTAPKPRPDKPKVTKRSEDNPYKSGCCKPKVAPPVYLDYSTPTSGGRNTLGGLGRGNSIIDKLKNVDVIEELKYFTPGKNIGDCKENVNAQEDCDYYYVCDDCGEMEPAPCCSSPSQNKSNTDTGNPVTYSRRQRFNFLNEKNTAAEEDNDGPPFSWPGDKPCCCPCCIAGLRRNDNCQCKCCQIKGRARVVNSFDEIPVGKNPESKPRQQSNHHCEDEEEDKRRCQELIPQESGIYFYDAEDKRFIRQVPRTPTPVVIELPQPPKSVPIENTRSPDMAEIIQCLPPRKRQEFQPQPIVMPPICGDLNDMSGIMGQVELAIRGQTLFNSGQLCGGMMTNQFPMAMVNLQNPTTIQKELGPQKAISNDSSTSGSGYQDSSSQPSVGSSKKSGDTSES